MIAARLSRRAFLGSLIGAPLVTLLSTPAKAQGRVEEVITSRGVRALLLREPTLPFISLSFQFEAGAAQDPEGREGLAHMLSGLLDEGAGPYDSEAFRRALEDNAIRLSFDADRDTFSGELKTLNDTRALAFELLALALNQPRFDEEPTERIRQQLLADLRRRETDPNYRAARQWFAHAFAGHPYARPTRGTPESLARIEVEDLRAYQSRKLARANLHIGVAGDITAEELVPLLDQAFGPLIEEPELAPVVETQPRTGGLLLERMPIPQSVVTFGHGGIDRQDPDYYAAYVVNYVLGGGGFSSRLTEEIREKRGLAYGVYTYLYDARRAPLWLGGVATRNDQVRRSIELVESEVARIAREGIAARELEDAKTYLTGSFPLRLTSNDRVARMLAAISLQRLGRDYLERRNSYIEAVSLEDANRVARRLFDEPILFSVVGDPEGLEAQPG